MRKFVGITVAVALMAVPALGANLNIAVQNNADGASSVNVAPGGVVTYRIVGTLSDSANDGLALWGADLAMSPSVLLSPATAGPSMGSFVSPQGITNPAGYGGTQSGNNLLQIGGGQNTIKNTIENAPFPIGAVVEGVAQSQVVLATGSVTMPGAGTYTLALSNVFANEIVDGQIALNGAFFQTVASGVGTVGSLTINVMDTATPVSIATSNPPDGHFDSLDTGASAAVTAGIGGAGTAVQGAIQYATVSVTFDGAVTGDLQTGDMSVACTGGACPTVTGVTGSGAGPYEISLSSVIPPLPCTTISFNGAKFTAGQNLQYRFSPGNVDQGTAANTQDLLNLIQALNNGAAAGNPARFNVNRTGTANTQDLLRIIQLLNGVLTNQAYNQAAVAACP
jgi:hypothetical protein